MILVIIIVVAWIVILTPSVIKRRSSWRDRLDLPLPPTAPRARELRPEPIVAPAYRLRAVDVAVGPTGRPGIPRPPSSRCSRWWVRASSPARPWPSWAMTRWPSRPVPRVTGTDFQPWITIRDRVSVGRPARGRGRSRCAGPDERGRGAVPGPPTPADALAIMAAFVVGTLALGFVPGASMVGSSPRCSGVALAAYVALLVHLRRMAEERDTSSLLRPGPVGQTRTGSRGGGPTPISGRYAHPSYSDLREHADPPPSWTSAAP